MISDPPFLILDDSITGELDTDCQPTPVTDLISLPDSFMQKASAFYSRISQYILPSLPTISAHSSEDSQSNDSTRASKVTGSNAVNPRQREEQCKISPRFTRHRIMILEHSSFLTFFVFLFKNMG